MHYVYPKWLKIFQYSLVCMSALILVIYLGLQALAPTQTTLEQWGISLVSLGLIVGHAIFALFVYPVTYQRFTRTTNAIGLIAYTLVLTTFLQLTNYNNILFLIIYVVFMFLVAMSGFYIAIGSVVIGWVLFIFSLTNTTISQSESIEKIIIVNSVATITSFCGWLLFKRWYINTEGNESIMLESLFEQEKLKSNTILESVTDGVMVLNTKGTVQILNQSAATMLGWQRDQAANLDYHSLIQVEQEGSKEISPDSITQILKSGKPEQSISLLQTQHGRHIYVDIVASPIYQEQKDHDTKQVEKRVVGIIAVLRDVDKQKRQEQQRSDFISTASHEMRTPVASIQGFIQLALNPKVCVVDEKARGYLEKADQATRHLSELFQDLLTVSQSEDGRLTISSKIVDINEFLTVISEQEQVAAEKKGLKIIFEKPQSGSDSRAINPLLYAHTDPDRLREVILNLFENAIKYTSSGMITVGATANDQSIIIRVSDTGIGIAEEDIPHIFQKFYRTDNTATREIGGTGLGLYISKQIIELLGGKIWVESTVGAGSTFYVSLPRIAPEEIAQLKQTKPQEV